MSFRETLWFKKGILETSAVDESVDAASDEASQDTLLPIEDRYLDDGSVHPADSAAYGLHTGLTQGLRPVEVPDNAGVPERVLIGELKRGRRPYIAIIAGSALAVCCAIALFV